MDEMDEDCVACIVDVTADRGIRAVSSTDVISAAAVTSTDVSGPDLSTVDVRTAPAGVATIVTSAIVFAAERSFEGHAAGIATCRITRIESDAACDRGAARGAATGTGSRGAIDD
jgi:hypothetical protein